MSGTVVILVALGLEYQAVRKYLTDCQVDRHPTGTLFEVGTLPGTAWRVALAQTGPGNKAAAIIAEQARQLFTPEALFFVGVAGAVKEDIARGDIVVATKVQAYQGGKETPEGFHARPEGWFASHTLLQTAEHALRSNQRLTRLQTLTTPNGQQPQVHFKPIAAGEIVLNSQTSPLRDQLHHHYNDVVAVEMESAGMAHAAHIGEMRALTVRGISDLADGEKYPATDAMNQPTAATNAAAATITIIESLPSEKRMVARKYPSVPGGTQPRMTSSVRRLSTPLCAGSR